MKTITLDLGPMGLPGEWLRFRDPKFMSWGERKAIVAKVQGKDVTDEQFDELFLDLVPEWRVSPAAEATDGPVVFEGKPNKTSMDQVPGIVYEAFVFRLKSRIEEPPVSP